MKTKEWRCHDSYLYFYWIWKFSGDERDGHSVTDFSLNLKGGWAGHSARSHLLLHVFTVINLSYHAFWDFVLRGTPTFEHMPNLLWQHKSNSYWEECVQLHVQLHAWYYNKAHRNSKNTFINLLCNFVIYTSLEMIRTSGCQKLDFHLSSFSKTNSVYHLDLCINPPHFVHTVLHYWRVLFCLCYMCVQAQYSTEITEGHNPSQKMSREQSWLRRLANHIHNRL